MKSPKNYKETYLKLVIIIAILLFVTGIFLLIFFEDGFMFIIASAFIQLGITLFVVDLFISNFASKLFKQEIIKNFREVLGINNPKNKLFPELITLMRPHPYEILELISESKIVYDEKSKNKPYNLAIIEKSIIHVQAREDNIHYHFFRGTDSGKNSPDNLKEIKLDGIILDKERDLIINHNKEKNIFEYTVKHNLKNGESYKFEISYQYSACMSDLNSGDVNYDEFIQQFIELTTKAKMVFRFPFNLTNYIFMIKRCDACNREKFIEPNIIKNKLIVEQENLDNGDCINIVYKKR